MLQKELNLQQEQPRKRRIKQQQSFREKYQSNGARIKLLLRRHKQNRREGSSGMLSFFPFSSSVTDLEHHLGWLGSGRLPSLSAHFRAEDTTPGDGNDLTLHLGPLAPSRSSCLQTRTIHFSLEPSSHYCLYTTASSAPMSFPFPFFLEHSFAQLAQLASPWSPLASVLWECSDPHTLLSELLLNQDFLFPELLESSDWVLPQLVRSPYPHPGPAHKTWFSLLKTQPRNLGSKFKLFALILHTRPLTPGQNIFFTEY